MLKGYKMFTEKDLDELIKQVDVYYKQVICFRTLSAEKEFMQLTKEEQYKWLEKNYLKKWFLEDVRVERL